MVEAEPAKLVQKRVKAIWTISGDGVDISRDPPIWE